MEVSFMNQPGLYSAEHQNHQSFLLSALELARPLLLSSLAAPRLLGVGICFKEKIQILY
jgi:hypothetical protein